jgi:leucyl/phenylalanyl-tRNA---protein transferase
MRATGPSASTAPAGSSPSNLIPWLPREPLFPPVDTALTEPDGLLAAGGDLSPERILAAYRRGIFPWYSAGDPILWWSPDPRLVLRPQELHITRSLAKTLRNKPYTVALDSCFADVIEACATTPRAGQPGTWITAEMRAAYRRLHELGYAHSVEVFMDDELVGGLYGIALGRAFFGESMFSRGRDASKIALAHLCRYLTEREFGIIDCQMQTAHLTSLGAGAIPRRAFVAELDRLVEGGTAVGRWPAVAAAGAWS